MTRPKIICIVGNIGVGKTTLINELMSALPDHSVICIDDFREKYNANDLGGELIAQDDLFEQIVASPGSVLYECTGTSKLYFRVLDAFDPGEILTIRLHAPLNVLKMRIEKRLRAPPFPYHFNIEASLKNIEMMLNLRSHDHCYDTNKLDAKRISQSILEFPELTGKFSPM